MLSTVTNESAREAENRGIRGVQLFPELVEILILMFPDDLALISDTVIRLQWLLNLLFSFCKVKDLVVNTIKIKVMVYKHSGVLAKTEVDIRWQSVRGSDLFHILGFKFYKAAVIDSDGR